MCVQAADGRRWTQIMPRIRTVRAGPALSLQSEPLVGPQWARGRGAHLAMPSVSTERAEPALLPVSISLALTPISSVS